MAQKKLILVIAAEQGYIRSLEENNFSTQNDILFTAITETYIPLLNLFNKLSSQNVPFKIGLVLSPVLCTLLSDPVVHQQYINALDKRIAFGDTELERNKNNPELLARTRTCLERLQKARLDFTQTYKCNLIEGFKYLAKRNYIELIPTAATFAYLPHFADLKEALSAQIDVGLHAQRHFFGESGDGFFLPYLGWADEIEGVLRSYNINYTIVDAKSLLFAKDCPPSGIFSLARTNKNLAIFAKDNETPSDIADFNNRNKGFAASPVYLNPYEDIGFDLNNEELSEFLGIGKVRVQTGFKYKANDSSIYSEIKAGEQVKKDALAFFSSKKEKLDKALPLLDGKDAILTCTIPAEFIGQIWHEGVSFIEQVIRIAYEDSKKDDGVALSLCRDNIENQFSLPKTTLYPCGENGFGYGEYLLDNSNSYMYRHVRTAMERAIDMAERFPNETGLKARLLNMGAREAILAQSGDWPEMMHEQRIPEFVEEQFKNFILSFTTVFDSLASNTVSTEWLTTMEKKHAVFPWLNYNVFSHKK